MFTLARQFFTAGILLAPLALIAQARIETDAVDAANRYRDLLPVPEKKEKKSDDIPMLYEGELEDSGPQLLLLEAPPHKWFQILCDMQWYATSNVAMVEHNSTFADVAVLTAQGAINAKPINLFGGKLSPILGFRYQNFLYGSVSGSNDLIKDSYVTVDSLNFETFTPYAQLEWRSGPWMAGVGARFSAYLSQDTGKTTYQEWAPSMHVGRSFMVGKSSQFTVDADFTWRLSHSFLPPGISLPPGWFQTDNADRYDIGLNIAYTMVLNDNWIIQPAYRFQFSDYTQASTSRQDYYNILSLTLGYYFNEYFSVRLFGSAEFRNSSDSAISDYQNYNGGIGLMGVLTF
ncbi:MAG: hypothetical protein LBV12_07270 [Puniceicoccales bacterium]|jgi:hypothetical protein|nr:hypothetical protein [Puniceicoccales bacterium]